MSSWGICNDGHGQNHCGKFEEPQNPDDGLCFPYRVKRDCSAPALPLPACEDEVYTTEYDPDDVTSPFIIVGQLFDQACNLILDQNNVFIGTKIN